MAVQVGELFAKLSLDTSEFDKGLEQSEGHASKFGGVLQTAIGFAAGGLIGKGLDIVGSAIGGIKDAMITGNAEFERYQTQFGVLLGSTDKAKQRLDELAKFGASTPFELPELVKADKVLTSFGIHSNDMLTIVGDVAAGTGASFEDMALLMGKFSAGSTGEVISRFQEMGIATKDELSKMGIQFDKAGSMTTPVAQAMPILEQLMKDKFGGMMDAQSKTFEGMISNAQDWMGQTGRIIGQPIFEVLKDKLAALLVFLSSPEVQAGITAFAQALATGIGMTIDFISNDVIPAFQLAWNTLGPLIMPIIPMIQLVIAAFQAGGTSTTQFGGILNWLAGVWQSLQPVIAAVTNVINAIVTTVFNAIKTFIEQNGDEIQSFFKETWNTISDIFSTYWSIIKIIVNAAVKFINAVIVPAFNAIATFIRQHGDSISQYLTNTWNIIKSVINIALAIIQGVVKVFLAVLQGDWQGAWNAIKTMVSTVWENIKTIIGAALSNLKIVISLAWDAIKGTATAAWNAVKGSIDSVWTNIKTSISSSTNSLKTILSGAWDSIKGTASSLWDGIKSAITGKFDAVKTGIDGTISSIKGALSGAWSDIESGARTAWNGIAGAVSGAFSSAVNGVRSRLNDIIDVMNSAIDAFNELPGPDIGHIPHLATGTNNFAGGLALVGERGPELVVLPRGSKVIPNNQTQQMMNNPGLTINQYITQAGSLVDEMDMALAYYNAI